jgi:hypothetical protein
MAVFAVTLPSPFTLPHSQFNEFLFASIGKEGSGMSLSVVSALARLEIDPWQEAARLAALPKDLAAAALDRLIRRQPAVLWDEAETRKIAARLIELLPPRHAAARPGDARVGGNRKTFPSAALWLVALALLAAALFGAMANGAQRTADHGASAAIASGVSSPAQP